MNKKNLKLIMELLFIFILPLVFICFTSEIKVQRQFTYDNQGNYETAVDTKQLSFDNSIIKYTKQIPYYTYSYELENGWANDFIYDMMNVINQLNQNENYGLGYAEPIEDYLDDLSMGSNIFNYIDGQYYILTQEIEYELEYKDNTNKWLYIGLFKISGDYYRYNNGVDQELENIWVEDITTIKNRDTSYDNYNYINFSSLYTQLQHIAEQYYTTNYLTGDIGAYPDNPYLPINYTITTNYETTNTIWGNIKELLINNLDLNDNVLLDIVLCYTILWVVMWIIWHLFYGLFELLWHVIPSPLERRI